MATKTVKCPRCSQLSLGGCALCLSFKDGNLPKYVAAAYLLRYGKAPPPIWTYVEAQEFINSVTGSDHD